MAKMLLHPSGGVTVDPAATLLKADQYATMVAAEELLTQAREQAAKTLEQAALDAEERKREGYEEGLLEGKAEIAAQMFDSVTASLDQLTRMESSFVDVVMQSVRTILGTFDKADLTEKVVSHALRLVRDEKKVVLRVSMEESAMVQERLADIVRRYPGLGRIDVMPDSSLGRGGCVMETELGVIDATLERQLKMIEDTFRHHLEERSG